MIYQKIWVTSLMSGSADIHYREGPLFAQCGLSTAPAGRISIRVRCRTDNKEYIGVSADPQSGTVRLERLFLSIEKETSWVTAICSKTLRTTFQLISRLISEPINQAFQQ